MYQAAVAIARITRTSEKMDVPLPQSNIHDGATPPGRGRMTRLIPTSARYPLSDTMIG